MLPIWLLSLIAVIIVVGAAADLVMIRKSANRMTHQVFSGFTLDESVEPRGGLVVTSLETQCVSCQRQLVVGDHITSIDGQPVKKLTQARKILQSHRHKHVILRVSHAGRVRDINLNRYSGGTARHGTKTAPS